MRNDFFLDFPGFHGAESRCHIRTLQENNKPVVIICSQLPQNLGTSVQNAYEIIRKIIIEKLKDSGVSERDKIYWVEHWPKGTGMLSEESDYYLVRESKSGEPVWTRYSTQYLSKELGYPIHDIEIPESILSGVSKEDIENRVKDWKKRLSRLYKEIERYVNTQKELTLKNGPTVIMHEELMQKYGVGSEKLRTLDIYRNSKLFTSFKPVGLWVIGANGRIDILNAKESYILVDTSDKYSEPNWTVYSSSKKTQGTKFNPVSFFQELSRT